VAFDSDHEGHSGAKVTDYAKYGNVTAWLQKGNPDVVLMHVGTNDASAGASNREFLQAYETLLCQMRTHNPNIRIVLSKLIGIDHTRYGQGVADRIRSYNTVMGEWAKKETEPHSHITLVDVYSGFDYQTMTRDGKHPNEAGDQFMAERYLTAIQHALAA
jgi:lysophospholipase L1-like esterase